MSRQRDAIWDALTDACGAPLTRNECADFGKTVTQLKEVGATPEQIEDFFRWWGRMFPKAILTHRCYRNHWSKFVNGSQPPDDNPYRYEETREEHKRRHMQKYGHLFERDRYQRRDAAE